MNCREALQLMYEYLDNELTDEMIKKIKNHLSVCEHCFDKFEFERLLNDCVCKKGQVAVDAEPLKSRVMENIRLLEEEDSRGFFSRFRPYFAVAAAVVLVVVGVNLVMNGGRSAAYAKVKPLVENHKRCIHERLNGDRSPMPESEIRMCLAGLVQAPEILLKPVSDRYPVYGGVVKCPECNAAHIVYEYAGTEISMFVFEEKHYSPPEGYQIHRSGKHEYHCGTYDGMNVIYWQCKGCWCAAVATFEFTEIISFVSVY